MKSKKFPSTLLTKIEKALETEQQAQAHPVAAFDADGTLWNTDLGESFFQYQIKNRLLADLPENPWDHYRKMKSHGDPRPAYLWLAQINRGMELRQVREWAQKHVEEQHPFPVFEEQRQLIQWLHEKGVKVYVITASVKWAVEPGASQLGIPADRVLGVATKVENGLITTTQEGLITYKEGKAQSLMAATPGVRPFLCCGNTTGDLHLLQAASKVALAVCSASPGSELYQTEQSLQSEANRQNWLTHEFC